MSREQRDALWRWQCDCPNYIYFVQRPSDSLIKIGRTEDIRRRMVALRSKYRAELLLAVLANVSAEKELHNRFELSNESGEWFQPTRNLVCFIDKLSAWHPTAVKIARASALAGETSPYLGLENDKSLRALLSEAV